MSGRMIGGPCPKCGGVLMRRERQRVFRSLGPDVAFCARCNAAWEIEDDPPIDGRAVLQPLQGYS